MEKKKKTKTNQTIQVTNQNTRVDKLEKKEELKQLLLLTEEKLTERFSDKNLDRHNEKSRIISLNNGKQVDIYQIEKFVKKQLNEYEKMFPVEWYAEIFRLKQITTSKPDEYIKPRIIGVYTNELIYHRFPKGVLQQLRIFNPYTGTRFRSFKHHQFLTEEGRSKVAKFIEESLEIMKTCDDWQEFRDKYFNECQVEFQLDVFEEKKKGN
ncbi:MAG: P63C domain-containing protein [Bacteroidota bacterium]